MTDMMTLLLLIAALVVVQMWVLPRFGIRT
jgi:hypothetical protein